MCSGRLWLGIAAALPSGDQRQLPEGPLRVHSIAQAREAATLSDFVWEAPRCPQLVSRNNICWQRALFGFSLTKVPGRVV